MNFQTRLPIFEGEDGGCSGFWWTAVTMAVAGEWPEMVIGGGEDGGRERIVSPFFIFLIL